MSVLRRVARLVLAGLGASLALVPAGPALAAADEPVLDLPADVCLEVAGGLPEEAMSTLVAMVSEVVAESPALFPAPTITPTEAGIGIDSGHPDLPARSGRSCLMRGSDWTARFARDFLVEGAELMLEQADRTPGFESSIELDWFPDEDRVRSLLRFSGPLGVPSGTCWIDDRLSIEPDPGRAVASGERGMDVSLLGDVVCGRFYGNLPDGGAGEQAVELLPAEVPLGDETLLRFVAETVDVLEDAIVMAGTVRLE